MEAVLYTAAMKTNPLGRTGLSVSELGYGAAPIGFLETEVRQVGALLNFLLDHGVNLIDTAAGYHGLHADYIHEMIDHAIKYVDGKVHTNTMENFWALLKRSLGGTYVSVAPEYLDAYLDEQVERFNARKVDDGGRFVRVMGRVLGRRLTYSDLVASK